MQLRKPLARAWRTLISSGGVHARNDRPLDVCHSFGDFRFRRVPSQLCHEELIIHRLKYPHDDPMSISTCFPIERLQEWQPKEFGACSRTFLQLHRL